MKVTVCLTSCGRLDLLEVTLASFFAFNSYPIEAFLVYEDSPDHWEACKVICDKYGVTLLPQSSLGKIGQINAIDVLYSKVKTEFIYHIEDDWETYRGGFIEQSMAILKNNAKIVNVWLRAENDTNGHPLAKNVFQLGGVEYKMLSIGYKGVWHGFTFNPGLRRLSDYKIANSFSRITKFRPNDPSRSEYEIGKWYYQRAFRAAIILGQGFVKHIGNERTVKP